MLNKLDLVFTFIIVLVILILVMIIQKQDPVDITHEHYNKLSEITPCGNMSEYYSNFSFIHDVEKLKEDIALCNSTAKEDKDRLYNFDDVSDCEQHRIDCEDISFMIDCIAEKYDISCEYYTYHAIGIDSHRGINCNVSGGYYEIF